MAVSDRIAVMNQGSVVQEGSAEDLYHRPASEFVATFVGRVNLVPGRLVESRRRSAVVEALGTKLRARRADRRAGVGDVVKLVVRPEAVELLPPGQTPLRATIATCTFLGEKTEFALQCEGVALQSVRYNASVTGAFSEGAGVSLRIDEDAITVLAEDRL